MTETDVRQLVLSRFGLRIEPHMSKYVADRIVANLIDAGIPVMGGDSRTGVPRRQIISFGSFAADSK